MHIDKMPDYAVLNEPFVSEYLDQGKVHEGRDRSIFLYTIHDGHVIPMDIYNAMDTAGQQNLDRTFINERDWGANAVARRLGEKLGLSRIGKVELARCVMDFGRFPGISPPESNHLTRHSINLALKGLKRPVMRRIMGYYDQISQCMANQLEEMLPDAEISRRELLQLAVHTYDEHNLSGTRRPAVSLIFQPQSYRDNARLPSELFDPLLPHQMAEFTCDRTLAYRIAVTMERRYIPSGINFPYSLPEGSVELRSQVWFFFRYLRSRYARYLESEGIETNQEVLNLVWSMLLNPNRRDLHTRVLKAWLHDFPRIPPDSGLSAVFPFQEAESIYEDIQRRLVKHPEMVNAYRFAAARPSSLAIEVRKDWLMEGANTLQGFLPQRIREDKLEEVTDALSEAINNYLEFDLCSKLELERDAKKSGTWAGRF